MNESIHLTEAERALVIELLQREMEELPAEIHHSRSTTVREELKHRREMVRAMLDRLQPTGVM